MVEERTNNGLARFLTIEHVVSLLITVFLIGGSWALVGKSVADNTEEINEVKEVAEANKESLQEIKTDVAVIKTEQHAATKTAERQEKSIDRVLEILQKEYGHNGRGD